MSTVMVSINFIIAIAVLYMYTKCKINLCIGIPVAWAISDREDSETIEAMFTVVKEKCPDAKVSTLMTDDGIKLYVFVYNFYATFISN